MPLPLINRRNTCYRNSVLHSLFSIDYFVNLVELGHRMTQKQTYTLLLDAARRFRRNNQPGQNAESTVRTFMRHIEDNGSAGNNQYNGQASFERSGAQDAAVTFLAYVMQRLCMTELTNPLML